MPDEDEEQLPVEAMEEDDGEDMPGCPGWMVTFGDAISLLMTFFVLILSFSDMSSSESKVKKFFVKDGGGTSDIRVVGGQAGSAIDVASGGVEGESGSGGSEDEKKFEMMEKKIESETLQFSQQNNYSINYSSRQMQDYFSESNISEDEMKVEANAKKEKFRVVFEQNFVFSTGRAHFESGSQEPLERIGRLLSELPNDITIGGYSSDYNKIAYPLYPSNAHLSIARANAIAQYLIHTWNVAPERVGIQVLQNVSKDGMTLEDKLQTKSKMIININSTFNGYMRTSLKEHEYKR